MSYLRSKFREELKTLVDDIIIMSTALEATIDKTITALVKQDQALAKEVVSGDDYFDEMQQKIETESISILSRQQPVAKDLRAVYSVIKIVTDLERIADHCEDISNFTLKLVSHTYIKPLEDLPAMAKIVKDMVRLTVDCFIEQDVIKARHVCKNDDIVDQYFERIELDVKSLMKENLENSEQLIDFLMIAKYFERMADHATNVAEWVIYLVDGEWFSNDKALTE